MTGVTCLLSGVPRSGTSLACRLLDQAENTVALSEPLKLEEFATLESSGEAVDYLERRFKAIRKNIERESVAPSTHVAGALSDARVNDSTGRGGLRLPRGEQGEIRIAKPLSEDFRLVVKHNALFAALVAPLSKRYRCVALVRNPLALLASWQTVDLPINRGRVPAGEMYDKNLERRLVAEPEALQRQLEILDWFFHSYLLALPANRILSYEQMVESNGVALFAALGIDGKSGEVLTSRNDSALYRGLDLEVLLAALVSRGGSWESLYARRELETAAETMVSGP